MTMFSDLLRHDREWGGLTFDQAARRLGISRRTYREAGERWPDWTTNDRIAAAYGWPRTFADG